MSSSRPLSADVEFESERPPLEPSARATQNRELLAELKYNTLQNVLIGGLFAVLFNQFCDSGVVWLWWIAFTAITGLRGAMLYAVDRPGVTDESVRALTIYAAIGITACAWGAAPIVCGAQGEMSLILATCWVALIVIAGADAFQADPIATSVLAFPATLPTVAVLLANQDRTSLALVAAIGLVYAHLAVGNIRARRAREIETKLKAENAQLLEDYREQARLASEELERRLHIERELRAARHRAEQLSSVDALTGIANRRNFDDRLAAEIQRAFRGQKPVSVILIDIDCFKQYNDALGHSAGDDCLSEIGQLLAEYARRVGDLAARYGGEEFVLLLPETDGSYAARIAESLRETIVERKIPHPDSPIASYVTASLGVATLIPNVEDTPRQLVEAADAALYAAKEAGRNQVCRAN